MIYGLRPKTTFYTRKCPAVKEASDNDIFQRGAGICFLDRVELGRQWNALFDGRHDNIHNELTDNFKIPANLPGAADFKKPRGFLPQAKE
jgi:hypothetical protein